MYSCVSWQHYHVFAVLLPDWWIQANLNLLSMAAQSPHPHGTPNLPEGGFRWAWPFGSKAASNLSQRGVWSCQGGLGLHRETPLLHVPLPLHLKGKCIEFTPRASHYTKLYFDTSYPAKLYWLYFDCPMIASTENWVVSFVRSLSYRANAVLPASESLLLSHVLKGTCAQVMSSASVCLLTFGVQCGRQPSCWATTPEGITPFAKDKVLVRFKQARLHRSPLNPSSLLETTVVPEPTDIL